MIRRVVLGLFLTLAARASVAAEPVQASPGMDSWALTPAGSENTLFDLALMPQTYYRRDALGNPLSGIRLAAWLNLASRSFADDKLRIVTSFRYDVASGAPAAIPGTPYGPDGPLFTPKLPYIMTAYAEYDATRDLKLRAGRQFYVDLADYLSFDGLRVQWKLPIPLSFDVYGGVRSSVAVTEGSVASSLYELDGVPQTEVQGAQPIVGAAVRWVGNMQAREEASIGYRQSWSFVTSQQLQSLGVPGNLASSAQVTAQELVASAARDFYYVYAAGGLAYELALDRLERARLSFVVPLSRFVPIPFEGKNRKLDLSLDYQRYQPAYSLDSIWNFFTMYAFDEFALGSAFHTGTLTLQAKVYERIYYAEIYDRQNQVVPFTPGRQYAFGGRVNGIWAFRHADILDGGAAYQNGFGGGDLFIDAGVRHRFDFPLEAYGRISVSNWSQSTITTNQGSAVGFVVGATYHLPYGASASLILQEVVAFGGGLDPTTGQTTTIFTSPVPEVFAVLDLARWL